jgi:hypothetical protein
VVSASSGNGSSNCRYARPFLIYHGFASHSDFPPATSSVGEGLQYLIEKDQLDEMMKVG